ncbi:hypothetical protein OF83DRAFT_1170974 [Amylostereum chailletii]|nr:hypothetical protein OF83DRAFT_1170974 [Amylostereum chailletii]
MGRTFPSSDRPNSNPVPVPAPAPVNSKPEPDFPTWSYASQWDPDSDEFWENAVWEAPLGSPQPPSPIESSDTSEGFASGGPPSPWTSNDEQILMDDIDLPPDLHFSALRVPPVASSLSTTRPRSASDNGRAFLGSTESPNRGTLGPRDVPLLPNLPLNWNSRRARAETAQILDDGDLEAEPRPFVVHTSSIIPIPVPIRPSTPPNARARGSFTDEDSFSLSPSPPPSVSPRVFVWEHARRMPESPTFRRGPDSPLLRRAPLPWPLFSPPQRV